MKETLLMYARYTKRANASVLALLDGLSPEALDEDRGNFYKSLAGLVEHILDGDTYFHGLFRPCLPPSLARLLDPTKNMKFEEGRLTQDRWEELKRLLSTADQATIDLIAAMGEEDFELPVKLDWYGGNPPDLPFHFLANHLFVHGTHHRGGISQILDSLKVDHDFSGIDLEFMR